MRAFLLGLLSMVLVFSGSPARAEDDPKPPAKPAEPPKEDKPQENKDENRGRIGFEPCPAVIMPAHVRNLGVLAMTGVVVANVVRGGPAEAAGMRIGDMLVKINGKEMPPTDGIDPNAPYEGRKKFDEAFAKIVEDIKPGDEVTLVLTRRGEELTIKAKAVSTAAMKRIQKGLPAEEEPKPATGPEPAADQGAVGFEALPLGSLTEKQRDDWKVKAASGVVVSRVVKGSPADLAGLKLGDALLKYGGVDLPSGQDLADAGKGAKDLVRDEIAKIEADLKVDSEIEILVRRDFKPLKLKAKAVDQATLKKLIEAESKPDGKKDGEKPADPPKEKPPEEAPKEK